MEVDIILCQELRRKGASYDFLGVFTELHSGKVPCTLRGFYLVVRMHCQAIEEGRKKLSVRIMGQDGENLLATEQESEVRMPAGWPSQTVVSFARINALPLRTFGEYAVNVAVNDRLERSFSLHLHRNPSASVASGQPSLA